MPKSSVRKQIEINTEIVEWFEKAYADLAMSTVINGLLNEFMNIHIDTGVDPSKVIRDSAREVKDQIDEGVSI